MKMDDAAVVRTYTNEVEAGLAASWLDAGNVPCELVSDDAGGTYPALQITRGVKLIVAKADEDRANEILDRYEEEIDPSILADESASGSDSSTERSTPDREKRRDDDSA